MVLILPLMTKMAYSDVNTYLKNRFGVKVYKASISLNVTCPNRDGTKGNNGCIFCSAGGSGEFASSASKSITEQIDDAIVRVSKKVNSDALFIAYFQSFTNTYCEAEYLKESILEAMRYDKICAVSIATRPDCLPDDILKVLEECNSIKPVMVELGFQTMHEETAKWFRRGYETSEFVNAVENLRKINIEVIAHVIFGLKNETKEMMLDTVRFAVNTGINGIKFTSLYVLKGTDLYEEYLAGVIKPLEMEEYFDIVEAALRILPQDVIVHRLTGDGPKSILVAPMWTANKRGVINYINKRYK